MKKHILTPEQIRHGILLRKQGKTKRELAVLFNVSSGTIWNNIFRKKIIYPKNILRCSQCEIALTREIPNKYIPLNFKIGDKCIGCYLKEKGIKYIELIDN